MNLPPIRLTIMKHTNNFASKLPTQPADIDELSDLMQKLRLLKGKCTHQCLSLGIEHPVFKSASQLSKQSATVSLIDCRIGVSLLLLVMNKQVSVEAVN